jgi:RNA polymerase-binding protein DksA
VAKLSKKPPAKPTAKKATVAPAKAKGNSRPAARVTAPAKAKSASKPVTKTKVAVTASSNKLGSGKAMEKVGASKMPVAVKPAKAFRPAPDTKPSNGKPARVPGGTLIPPPIATKPNAKPGKNQAGLAPKELEVFRDLLLQKRRELVGDMYSMEREALQRNGENLSNLPLHMADMGTDNYEQEFTLGLMEKDRNLLREINTALLKIQDGRYGICEGTGKPISKARLEVQPWAKYSIEHARKLENRGVR